MSADYVTPISQKGLIYTALNGFCTIYDIGIFKQINCQFNKELNWYSIKLKDISSKNLFNVLANCAKQHPSLCLHFYKIHQVEQLEEIRKRRCINEVYHITDLDILNAYAAQYVPDHVIDYTYHYFLKSAVYAGDWVKVLSLIEAKNFDIWFSYNKEFDLISIICRLDVADSAFRKAGIFQSFINKNEKQLNTRDNVQKVFPLHRIVAHGTGSMVEYVLKKCVNINVYDELNRSPLHYAVRSKKHGIIKLLCENKAVINCADAYGKTPFHYATQQQDFDAIQIIHPFIFDSKNIQNYLDILHKKDREGRCILHYLALNDEVKIFKFLFIKGVDVNIQDREDNSLLHLAIQRNSYEIVPFLLQCSDISPNIKNESTMTPLHWIIYEKRKPTKNFDALLNSEKIDKNALDEDLHTPLHYACLFNRHEMIKQLLKKNTELKQLQQQGEKISEELFVKTNVCDKNDNTPLHLAAGSSAFQAMQQLLIDENVKLNVTNKKKRTALHKAVLSKQHRTENKIKCVRLLLKKGASFNGDDKYNKTALLYAFQLAEAEIALLLINHYDQKRRILAKKDYDLLFSEIEKIKNESEKWEMRHLLEENKKKFIHCLT